MSLETTKITQPLGPGYMVWEVECSSGISPSLEVHIPEMSIDLLNFTEQIQLAVSSVSRCESSGSSCSQKCQMRNLAKSNNDQIKTLLKNRALTQTKNE